MKKLLPLVIVAIATIIIVVVSYGTKVTKVVDWEESFNEKSSEPYGVSVLYKELPILFKDQKFRTVYHLPYSYLDAHSEGSYGDHVAEGSFIIIGNSDYLYDEYFSVDKLLKFAEEGNTLFISDYQFIERITDTLKIETDYIETGIGSSYQLSLNYTKFTIDDTKIDRSAEYSYFSAFDDSEYTTLGYANRNENKVNFINVPFGDGTILLHLEPKIFTNYNILKEDHYKYIEGVLSFLPENNLYFDSYTKIYTGYNGNVEKKSDLSWFLEQEGFKWAWYFGLLLLLIFVIFNAKRRQRIIKIVKPLQNTTVAFVKTISNLYFETQDHKNLVDKKITYFLEKVRTDFNLDTAILDEEFITRLASKSGKKKEQIEKLIKYINWLRTKNEFFEENLIKLNRHIEEFYL